MTRKPNLEWLIHGLIVVLSLIILWLLLLAPPDLMNTQVVYQGF